MLRGLLLSLLLLLSPAPSFAQNPTAIQTFNGLATRADAATHSHHYAESAALWIQAIHTQALLSSDEADRNPIEYNAACSFALAGDRDNAFLWLSRAIEDGSLNLQHTVTDTDLTLLHPDPRWTRLIQRIELLSTSEKRHWSAAALNTPYTPNLSDAEKLAGLSELWAEARYGFANFWHVPTLDWDATYLAFIPRVTATRSTLDFYKVLQRFYALLQDGHTNVYPPEELPLGRLPLRTRLIDDHVLFVGTRDPAFQSQGIQVGDELLAINDQPVLKYATENIRPYVSASSPQDLDMRTYDLLLLSGSVGDTLTIKTQNPAGINSSHRFVVPKWPPAHLPSFELRTLPGNIVYVALNSFGDDSAAKEFDQHFAEIASASALILDVRENGGGNGSVAFHILSTLIDRSIPFARAVSPRYIATTRARGNPEIPLTYPSEDLQPDPRRHFAGPTVLLTSPRTFSAAEDLAVVFVQSHRGKIVGEPTGGSTGQPLSFRLPGGGSARICTKHDSFADGKEFVGIGVQPDVPAHLSRADIEAGRDTVLETAVLTLQSLH